MKLADQLRAALGRTATTAAYVTEGELHGLPEGDPSLAAAAVLVPIVDRSEPGVILTQRTQSVRRHPGQIAFPGGRVDPEDETIVAAALREAEEEIGLPRTEVDVVGTVDNYRTGTGFDITPVLGVVPVDLALTLQPDEVAAVFEVPLSYLLDPANRVLRSAEWQGSLRTYYEISWEGRRIWGATAAMIVNLSRRLAGL